MTYYVKGLIQKEYETQFAEVTDFIVLQITGLGGIDNNRMRGALQEKGIHLTIVKNSMMRRALEALSRSAAKDLFLAGPCTVVYGGGSMVDVAKELTEWAKKFEVLQFKGAYVEGAVMDGAGVGVLAKMPTRSQLQGQIVQAALTPGGNIAGALTGPGGAIAGCIKSLIEKLEKAA